MYCKTFPPPPPTPCHFYINLLVRGAVPTVKSFIKHKISNPAVLCSEIYRDDKI